MSTTTNSKRKTNLVATMLMVIVTASLTNIVLGAESNNQCDEPIEYQSRKCNGKGKYVCGVCECNDAYFGERCECYM